MSYLNILCEQSEYWCGQSENFKVPWAPLKWWTFTRVITWSVGEHAEQPGVSLLVGVQDSTLTLEMHLSVFYKVIHSPPLCPQISTSGLLKKNKNMPTKAFFKNVCNNFIYNSCKLEHSWGDRHKGRKCPGKAEWDCRHQDKMPSVPDPLSWPRHMSPSVLRRLLVNSDVPKALGSFAKTLSFR